MRGGSRERGKGNLPGGVLLSSVVINFVCAVRNRTERGAGNLNGNDTCRE